MMLIGQFDSPFVRRVAITLHHYGLQFEHRPWSVWAHADEIAKYSPLRRVPVLVMDEGETLLESAAILDALDDLAPEDRRLIPPSGPRRRAILRTCALATGLADKAVILLYEARLRTHEHRSTVWTHRCTTQIQETLHWLERERSNAPQPYWYGELTHADIAVACALRFVREAHPELVSARTLPSLSAECEFLEAQPLFRGAVQALHVAAPAPAG